MNIYKAKINYRKIYENAYGPIPKDENGKSYHIHHIDGNRNNNSIENLIALSPKEHYEVHLKQKDYGAAYLLSNIIGLDSQTISESARLLALKRLENGTHNWCNGGNLYGQKFAAKKLKELGNKGQHYSQVAAKNGTHNFQTEKNSIRSKQKQQKLFKEGKHNFQKMLDLGTHPSLNPKTYTCPHCGKTGKSNVMFRYHFDKCYISMDQKPSS